MEWTRSDADKKTSPHFNMVAEVAVRVARAKHCGGHNYGCAPIIKFAPFLPLASQVRRTLPKGCCQPNCRNSHSECKETRTGHLRSRSASSGRGKASCESEAKTVRRTSIGQFVSCRDKILSCGYLMKITDEVTGQSGTEHVYIHELTCSQTVHNVRSSFFATARRADGDFRKANRAEFLKITYGQFRTILLKRTAVRGTYSILYP